MTARGIACPDFDGDWLIDLFVFLLQFQLICTDSDYDFWLTGPENIGFFRNSIDIIFVQIIKAYWIDEKYNGVLVVSFVQIIYYSIIL